MKWLQQRLKALESRRDELKAYKEKCFSSLNVYQHRRVRAPTVHDWISNPSCVLLVSPDRWPLLSDIVVGLEEEKRLRHALQKDVLVTWSSLHSFMRTCLNLYSGRCSIPTTFDSLATFKFLARTFLSDPDELASVQKLLKYLSGLPAEPPAQLWKTGRDHYDDVNEGILTTLVKGAVRAMTTRTDATDVQYSEFMAEEVLHNFRMLNAKEVIFTGFRDDRSIAASQIDAAKECMLQMNYVMTVAFAFHAISQVSELLTNKKPLSPFVGTLKIDLMEGAESEMSAEALAWILSRAFDDASTDLRQLSKVSVRVRRLRSAISLVQSIIQVASTGSGPESLKLMLSDIAFDVELEVAAYKASLAVDHAPETAISVISSWARRGDNFDYTLSVSRRTSDADFKMTIVQDTESTLAFGNAHSLTIDAVLPGSSYITELEELQRKEEMHRRLNNNPTLPEQSETESGLWDFFERCEEDGQKYTKCKSCSYRFSEPDDTNCRRSNKYRQRRHHKT
ncbi:hypothetical protein AAVH_28751, partial [Aphelenchoides avenae]